MLPPEVPPIKVHILNPAKCLNYHDRLFCPLVVSLQVTAGGLKQVSGRPVKGITLQAGELYTVPLQLVSGYFLT